MSYISWYKSISQEGIRRRSDINNLRKMSWSFWNSRVAMRFELCTFIGWTDSPYDSAWLSHVGIFVTFGHIWLLLLWHQRGISFFKKVSDNRMRPAICARGFVLYTDRFMLPTLMHASQLIITSSQFLNNKIITHY